MSSATRLPRDFAMSIALVAALSIGSARAVADEAGCAALAHWVKARVAAAAGDGLAARKPPVPLPQASSGRQVCSATAAVASRAFGEAVSGLSVRLSWNDGRIRRGDYCSRHDLRQCYPSHDRMSPWPPPRDFAFVQRAWQGVTRALASQMPYGSEGDLTSFSDASLAAVVPTASSTMPRPRDPPRGRR